MTVLLTRKIDMALTYVHVRNSLCSFRAGRCVQCWKAGFFFFNNLFGRVATRCESDVGLGYATWNVRREWCYLCLIDCLFSGVCTRVSPRFSGGGRKREKRRKIQKIYNMFCSPSRGMATRMYNGRVLVSRRVSLFQSLSLLPVFACHSFR